MTTTTEPDTEPDLIEQLDIPESTQRPKRVTRVDSPDSDVDDIVTAEQRIKKFWSKHPNGQIATTVDSPDGGVTYTARAEIWREAPTDVTEAAGRYSHATRRRGDASGTATRSSRDDDAITAARPQEAAETAAIGRALRFLGIEPTKPRKKSTD